MINRPEISRALAKALAYKESGKDEEAERWAARLVQALECNGILSEAGREASYRTIGER